MPRNIRNTPDPELTAFAAKVGGVHRASKLHVLWATSQATPDWDIVTNKDTKFEVFRRQAVSDGFTRADIDAFMNICT